MVKIPHAETPEPTCGVKDSDKLKEERDLEDQNKE